MEDLRTLKSTVRAVLESDKLSRSSDMRLYLKVCERANESALQMRFGFVLENLNELGLPPIESVSRMRRKCQEENPFLQAKEIVKEAREERQEVFREFAKSGRRVPY